MEFNTLLFICGKKFVALLSLAGLYIVYAGHSEFHITLFLVCIQKNTKNRFNYEFPFVDFLRFLKYLEQSQCFHWYFEFDRNRI